MKTMLDLVVEFMLENCSDLSFVQFNEIFDYVEKNLKDRWEVEASDRSINYDDLRVEKLGQVYRLLTVDSRFTRSEDGNWSIRVDLPLNEQ